MCRMQSSVCANSLRIRVSLSNKDIGSLIASEQIILSGSVIFIDTVFSGARYRITLDENLTAFVISFVSS